VASQRSLVGLGLDVRMGIDVGVADERGDDYFGLTLSRCARVMGLAHGGQILVTSAVEELLRDALPTGVWFRDLGLVRLRDFGDDTRLFQVVAAGLRRVRQTRRRNSAGTRRLFVRARPVAALAASER
jgi:class 3 adenylate cyclase